jgi:UDP-glucose:glycoprotein glucosyltransferase
MNCHLQKEPKLVRARKIPEWEEYDAEISQFSRKLAEHGLIHSRFAAADTRVLANEGPPATHTDNANTSDMEPDDGANTNIRDEL